MPHWILQVVRWGARILSVIAVLYFVRELEAFVMAGGFPDAPRAIAGVALLILMLVGLVVAWFREFPGAMLALCSWAAFAILAGLNRLEVMAVFALPAALFLLDAAMRHSVAWKMRVRPH